MATSSPPTGNPRAIRSQRNVKAFVLCAALLLGAAFVWRYVFHYYLHYNAASYYDYWPRRGTLLIHITSGMLALLLGPWQFSRRLRSRYMKLHRVSGRVYMLAVLFGSLAAFRLAWTTSDGWAWGFGVAMLAVAWLSTSTMAFWLILQRHVTLHRDWMVRSYVVTFGFVLFRLLNDYGPTSRLQPAGDRAVAAVWACWTLPLLVTEIVLAVKNLPKRVTVRG